MALIPSYIVRCGSKPIVWVDSLIHAREWIAGAATTYLAKVGGKEGELLELSAETFIWRDSR